MCSYSLALGDYSLEPDRKLVASVVDNVAMLLVIIVHLSSLWHGQSCLGGSEQSRKGRLLRRRRSLRADLQSLNRKTQFLSTLGTVAAVTLDDLTRSF